MSRPPALRALLAVAATLLLGAGCTQLDVPDGGLGAPVEGGPRAAPLPVRAALAPLVQAYDATFRERAADGAERDPARAPLALDGLQMDLAVRHALGERGRAIFARLDPVNGSEEALPASGAEVVLRVRATRGEVVFVGRNGWYIPNLTLLWFFTFFGSWPVADETYAAEVDLAWEAIARSRDAVIASGTATVRVEKDASDFDRGLDVFGILHLPGAIEQKGWETLGRRFAPFVAHEAGRALAAAVEPALERALGTEGAIDQALAARHALVIGVPRTLDGPAPGAAGADQDAARVADALGRAGYAAANVTLLDGSRATLGAVTAALDALAARVRPRDDVLVYIAGPGRAFTGVGGPADPALLLAGSRAADPAGALPLAALERRLAALTARRTLVVLDTAFGGGAARGLGPAPDAKTQDGSQAAAQALLALGRGQGRALLAAARVGQGAHEAPGPGGGIFTHHLLRALGGAADEDHDGRLTLAEASRFLAEETASMAGLLGMEQEAVDAGDPALVLPLTLPRASDAAPAGGP